MFKVGSNVSWYSYGHDKKGTVIAIVPAGEVILKSFRPSVLSITPLIKSQKESGYLLTNLSRSCVDTARNEESYLISVRNVLYWPKTKYLT